MQRLFHSCLEPRIGVIACIIWRRESIHGSPYTWEARPSSNQLPIKGVVRLSLVQARRDMKGQRINKVP